MPNFGTTTLRMNCLYVHNTDLGYGRMGVKLTDALRRMGVDIFDDLPAPAESGAMKFIPHVNGQSGVCGHVAWLATPGHCRGYWEGQTRSLLTMWESNLLPEPFREALDKGLKVVDSTAFSLCMDNNMPMRVFAGSDQFDDIVNMVESLF